MRRRNSVQESETDGRRKLDSCGGRSLADALKDACASLHLRAERTGILADLIRGSARPAGYVLLLRNLHVIYRQLESELDALSWTSRVSVLVRREMYRTSALERDLEAIYGFAWERSIEVLPEARLYADCIERAGRNEGLLLVSHAYVRFLGDLNGGLILSRVLANKMGLTPPQLNFHSFPAIADLSSFRQSYRAAIGDLAVTGDELVDLVAEARAAFTHNIVLSEAVMAREHSVPH